MIRRWRPVSCRDLGCVPVTVLRSASAAGQRAPAGLDHSWRRSGYLLQTSTDEPFPPDEREPSCDRSIARLPVALSEPCTPSAAGLNGWQRGSGHRAKRFAVALGGRAQLDGKARPRMPQLAAAQTAPRSGARREARAAARQRYNGCSRCRKLDLATSSACCSQPELDHVPRAAPTRSRPRTTSRGKTRWTSGFIARMIAASEAGVMIDRVLLRFDECGAAAPARRGHARGGRQRTPRRCGRRGFAESDRRLHSRATTHARRAGPRPGSGSAVARRRDGPNVGDGIPKLVAADLRASPLDGIRAGDPRRVLASPVLKGRRPRG